MMQIEVTEFNVLIDQDVVAEKTKGGLYIPDDRRDRDKHAQTWGTIIATGPRAFSEDDIWGDIRPKAGDRVFWARHSGGLVEIDGKEYRIVKDKDVVARVAA